MAGSQAWGETDGNPIAINVTPMVDVIFCLCLFFMCSFHFKQVEGWIDTQLPRERGITYGEYRIIPDEIRVVLSDDPATGAAVRRVHGRPPARSIADLVEEVRVEAAALDASGNHTWRLVIDAAPQVPWQDVIRVMDLSRRHRIERIELAAPGRRLDE